MPAPAEPPAGTDIRDVRQQLARIERRVNQLSDEVSDREESTPVSGRAR